MADSKIMHPVSKIGLRPSTDFGGTQVRDESTNHSRYAPNWAKAQGKSGGKTVPGGGHRVRK